MKSKRGRREGGRPSRHFTDLFSRVLFSFSQKLLCSVEQRAQYRAGEGSFRMDISTKLGKEIPSRNLREKGSAYQRHPQQGEICMKVSVFHTVFGVMFREIFRVGHPNSGKCSTRISHQKFTATVTTPLAEKNGENIHSALLKGGCSDTLRLFIRVACLQNEIASKSFQFHNEKQYRKSEKCPEMSSKLFKAWFSCLKLFRWPCLKVFDR